MSGKIRRIRLKRLEGQLGHVAYQITKFHFSGFAPPDPVWRPAVNIFECDKCWRVCVALAGVKPGEVKVQLVPGKLTISGERLLPEPSQGGCTCEENGGLQSGVKTVRVLAMEIDYGDFERELELPADADYTRPQTRWDNGLLWIEIPRRYHA